MAELLDRWRAGAKAEQSLGAHGINVSYTTQDPYSSFTRFLRCDLHAPSGVNWGYHCDAEMDELLKNASLAFTPEERDAGSRRCTRGRWTTPSSSGWCTTSRPAR